VLRTLIDISVANTVDLCIYQLKKKKNSFLNVRFFYHMVNDWSLSTPKMYFGVDISPPKMFYFYNYYQC
jgi:hypothetical protein